MEAPCDSEEEYVSVCAYEQEKNWECCTHLAGPPL